MLTFGSLFAGIGGFDLGFERAGMKCAYQVERDTHCQTLLGNRFGATIYDDVTTIGKQASTDLICGGFPCQDVSVAGQRKGLAGKRSGLWFEFLRIIKLNTPRWVVIENVPGLLSSNEGRDMLTIVSGLAECGYRWSYRILDSQYFGVAQRRRRVFIVASLGSGRCAQVLFERESGTGNTAPRREAEQGYSDVAGTLAASGGGMDRPAGNANELDFCIPTIARSVTTREGLRWNTDQDNYLSIGWDAQRTHTIAIRNSNTSSNGHGILTDGTTHTLGGSSDAIVSGIGVRRLTPTECERLQGFPDGWTEGFSDSTRYKMLGNAVSVPVAEWIGRRIVEIEHATN